MIPLKNPIPGGIIYPDGAGMQQAASLSAGKECLQSCRITEAQEVQKNMI